MAKHELIKVMVKDKVDVIMNTAFVVTAVLDIVSGGLTPGGYALFSFYTLYLWYRMAYFKRHYLKNKNML